MRIGKSWEGVKKFKKKMEKKNEQVKGKGEKGWDGMGMIFFFYKKNNFILSHWNHITSQIEDMCRENLIYYLQF